MNATKLQQKGVLVFEHEFHSKNMRMYFTRELELEVQLC
jgi:hypothetical protein